eukprot:CAMPEP_0203678572 /NCGR_PEP_ID=MMETSP0090-20130426/32501_1 /ASSEMBLY_ACC=CAM_ASM_001088 /TAXON_ID=426623 /ORGANISM="Chaetoceros affinis, Strain CCMP159" /LENGTH=228 /DNA_ID=CAMNT_0050545879 /DNA_START=175 /DNA_END=861 /DNA_ORIENTATION=+
MLEQQQQQEHPADPESHPSSSSSSSPSHPSAEQKATIQREMNLSLNLLAQTKDLLKQMTIESRSVDNATDVEECKKLIQIAKANHANLKDDVESIQNDVNHYLLLSSSSSKRGKGRRDKNKKSGVNAEVREHLLSTTNSLSKQNSNLEKSKRIMADTEMIAMEITEELSRQRETIESSHARVRGVTGLSNQARRILVNMQRREVQQKMVVYGVGAVLVFALLFLLGFF